MPVGNRLLEQIRQRLAAQINTAASLVDDSTFVNGYRVSEAEARVDDDATARP